MPAMPFIPSNQPDIGPPMTDDTGIATMNRTLEVVDRPVLDLLSHRGQLFTLDVLELSSCKLVGPFERRPVLVSVCISALDIGIAPRRTGRTLPRQRSDHHANQRTRTRDADGQQMSDAHVTTSEWLQGKRL